jgi:hypothetical protein
MNERRYIVIENWDGATGFQHYKDRTPLWIKNYTELMSRDTYLDLTFHQRGVLHGLWLEYARARRQLPDSTVTISRRLGHRVTRATLDALNHAGFITFSASKPLADRYQDSSLEKNRGEKKELSRPTPVDNSQEKFLKFADEVGLWGSQRLDALNLGPALLEEAMRATERCGPTNRAAYFDVCVKGFLSAQRQWKSSMPLEQRLEIYVRNAGYIYEDDDLESELFEKGADDVMVKRLVRVAEEVRNAA